MDREKTGGGNNRPADVTRRMDDIGDRFRQRLLVDIAMMREILADMDAGDLRGCADLEPFAHRLHGSSAMFDLAAVSACAGELEQLLVQVRSRGSDLATHLPAIRELFGRLEAEGNLAARSAGKP